MAQKLPQNDLKNNPKTIQKWPKKWPQKISQKMTQKMTQKITLKLTYKWPQSAQKWNVSKMSKIALELVKICKCHMNRTKGPLFFSNQAVKSLFGALL